MQELSEEGSRRIVTGDYPINAGKDAEAMRVDGMGKGGAREGGACIRSVRSNTSPMRNM